VSDCGVCGIAGGTGVDDTLVEDNLVERIGGLELERIWEAAGLKLHCCNRVLIRRNVFRHIPAAGAIWLDYLTANCRITRNVIADVAGYTPAVHVEAPQAKNLVDGNFFWNIGGRLNWLSPPTITTTPAVGIPGGELGIVANNFFGQIRDGFAVEAGIQTERIVNGRSGLCRRHAVYNNLCVACPRRLSLAQLEQNACDGNFYDAAGNTASFQILHPEPAVKLNLRGWQDFYGQDRRGAQARMEAEFDAKTLVLKLRIEGRRPVRCKVAELPAAEQYPGAGPFTAAQWKTLIAGKLLALNIAPSQAVLRLARES
jgi:hypothetical protein